MSTEGAPMEQMADTIIDFERFARHLAGELGWDADQLRPGALLEEDCGLDSIGMYELVLLVEDFGVEVDEDDLLSWYTLGDVHVSVKTALLAQPAVGPWVQGPPTRARRAGD